ncbi:NnrS family protein [Moraxella atlantae]|uniref:NnrS protein n=1 Tax=Faucicola atlantae TaxID=34059 RepID=A0A378Q5N7_9GAMM|nr:NnrS family protein [Moraxella atlantae]OPH33345.1 NnrS family protein [Moraxella atlantae]STY95982.1 NnrS protein [Moraxella atlantae]
MQQIQLPSKRPTSPHPVLNLGFRVFFLSAAVFAMLTMAAWAYLLSKNSMSFGAHQLLPAFWHGHELVFGYSLAVIAGFLLTAVKTWTNQPMPFGWRLLAIWLCWALARVVYLFNGLAINGWLRVACAADIAFWLSVTVAVVKPIWMTKQKRQIGIVAKLLLLLLAQVWFYIAVFHEVWQGVQLSLWAALYVIIGIVLTMARRVMPMFIQNGIAAGGKVVLKAKNSDVLDKISLIGLFGFMLSDVLLAGVWNLTWANWLVGAFAAIIAIANALRLKNWYLPGLWQRPMVWSLWISLLGMVIGFALFAVLPLGLVGHSLAMHTVALAGIGMMTLSMMARVALGHTGRSVHQPLNGISLAFGAMVAAWAFRAILPLALPNDAYLISVGIAQGLWILAFVGFIVLYAKILWSPRTDGLFG